MKSKPLSRPCLYAILKSIKIAVAQDEFGVTLKQTAYAFDSATINLCLALFPWAKFRKHKGAIKLHTLSVYICFRCIKTWVIKDQVVVTVWRGG